MGGSTQYGVIKTHRTMKCSLSGHGNDGLAVGLGDLTAPFQHGWLCDSTNGHGGDGLVAGLHLGGLFQP